MGGSQIRKVNIEQTAASGRCFDVSGGFTGNPPTIDFTSFSYVGEGTRWEFGETGLTDSDFGALRGANVEAYGTVSAGRGLFDAGIALPVHDIQVQVNLHATDSTNLVYATDKYGAQIPGFNGMVCGQLVWEIGANQHCGIAPFIKAAGGGGGLGLDVAKGLSLGTAVPILARDSNGFLQIKTSTGGYEGLTFKGHLRVKL